MKAIKHLVRRTIGLSISRPTNRLIFLFSLIFELAVCPVVGQANNGIKAHLNENRLFLYVEDSLLGHPILFIRQGVGQLQVTWTKENDHLMLQVFPIVSLSGTTIPINQDYRNEQMILGRFPILLGPSDPKNSVIDATDFMLGGHIPWYPNYVEEPAVSQLSFIESVGHLEFETLIRVKKTVEYKRQQKTVVIDYSFLSLPDPMRPRLFDHRMGFATEDLYETTPSIGSIMRWRLEKKHKDSLISEPVRPIIFYYGPNLPDKWKPYVKAGILEWTKSFEKAGFKNALVVREFPQDIDQLVTRSMQFSVVRWKNYDGIRGSESKKGSTVRKYVDFRTGEILKADIVLGSSYQSLADEYFVRCAPLDPRAQQYPFPNGLMGQLIRVVTAHEAGHALGLKDGNFGEFSYPAQKMRDTHWLETMGHTPSIMNYARHNYMAQPEDSIPPSLLLQRVGPMDVYQIQWGYTALESLVTSEQEHLQKWIHQQDSIAWYRFNRGAFNLIGPDMTNEVMDNNEPMTTTYFGLKNIQRVLELLPKVEQKQSDPTFLKRLYQKTINLWYDQMQQVLSLIGGYTVHNMSSGQQGNIYKPISAERQQEAVEFLSSHAFRVPDWLSHPSFLYRIQYSSDEDFLMDSQLRLLSDVLNPSRWHRLKRMEDNLGYNLISLKFIQAVRVQLFQELESAHVSIGKRRQQLQKAFIELLTKAISENRNYERPESRENSYLHADYTKAIFENELVALEKDVKKSLRSTEDEMTKIHLKWCLNHIKK